MDYSLHEDIIESIFNKVKSLVMPSEENNYKSKFIQSNLLLYLVVLFLILKVTTTAISINFPQNIFFADIAKSTLENFINQTRQSVGLAPLSENDKLNQAARMKAENMVQNQYFNHTSPSGITPWVWFSKAGYNYKYAGENLAIGFYESEEVYNAWLNSPSHKANIVNPNYTEVGTAVLGGFGGGNTIVVVQEFGSPAQAKTVVAKTSSSKSSTSSQTSVQPKTEVKVNTNERVLSQEVGPQMGSPSGTDANNTQSKLINYVLYSYDDIIQGIIYGISLIVMCVLLSLIFFNFNIHFKRELVFRAFLIVVLLSVATLVNKEIIVSIIPHQIFI